MIDIFDIFGLCGVALMIYCYARVQWRREYAREIGFSFYNLLGAILLIVSLIHNWNLPSFVSNTVWGLISLYGIYRCLKYKRRSQTYRA